VPGDECPDVVAPFTQPGEEERVALRTKWRPKDRFLVRHKDPSILVVEKKAGLLTVRTESGKGENLLALLRMFVGGRGRSAIVLPVHRLDRAVSGLLVFARSHESKDQLVEQFRTHTVERRYVAAVRGIVADEQGTFESRLVLDDPSLIVRSEDGESTDGDERGRRAVTHYRVVERLKGANATIVEVELETGLRNQIRVHFAEAGHPLLGDLKYGPKRHGSKGQGGGDRVFLHAHVLGFDHPATRRPLRFEAPLPPDLHRWRDALRKKR
jgi:23S rRNA pseudouridine1911/1915/1917 synthase